MEFSEIFSFLSILKESIKVLCKNVKLVALITLSSIVLNSSLFLLFTFFLAFSVTKMSITVMQTFMPDPTSFDPQTTPLNPDPMGLFNILKTDLSLLLAVEVVFFFSSSIISFLFGFATIVVSSKSYSDKTLSAGDLFTTIKESYMRPMITSMYVTGLWIGYFGVVLALIFPLVILYPNPIAISFSVLVGIAACVFYLYLVVTWAMAVVVSVEEKSCYGLGAFAKSEVLVKGKRIQGFLINVTANIIVLIVLIVFGISKIVFLGNKGLVNQTLYGLFVVNGSLLMKMFLYVTYTVLYFECKKHHGESVELESNVEYSKLQNTEKDIP